MIVDTIHIAYRILFSLQLEMEGYKDDLNPFVKITPDEATETLFASYGMLIRQQRGAYVALIDVVPEGPNACKPEILLKDPEVFRFELQLDASLLSRCHLASYDFVDHVVYISNAANNVVGTDVLLTQPLATYNNVDTYKKGYLVKSGGAYYKAIKESSSGDVHVVSEPDYWKAIPDNTYISQTDLRTRASFTTPLNSQTIVVAEVKHSAALTPSYRLLDGALRCREIKYTTKLLVSI
jgi:hypothetical protein